MYVHPPLPISFSVSRSLFLSRSLSLSLYIYIYIYIYISLSLSLFLFLSHTHTHTLSLSLSLSPSLCLLSVAVPISYEQVANSCLRDILPKLRQAAPAEENPAKKKKGPGPLLDISKNLSRRYSANPKYKSPRISPSADAMDRLQPAFLAGLPRPSEKEQQQKRLAPISRQLRDRCRGTCLAGSCHDHDELYYSTEVVRCKLCRGDCWATEAVLYPQISTRWTS